MGAQHNVAEREGVVSKAAGGKCLLKTGFSAFRASADGRCSTIAGQGGQNETPGVISRGCFVCAFLVSVTVMVTGVLVFLGGLLDDRRLGG